MTAPLWGSKISGYVGRVDSQAYVVGSTPSSLSLQASLTLTGGYDPYQDTRMRLAPERYTLTMTATVSQDVLQISQFKILPANR